MINSTLENITLGLNNEQAQAVSNSIETCTKIVAGAGTGKTKIISKRYVKLIHDLLAKGEKKPLEHILVITFTEKASIEMKERIYKELKENHIEYFGQEPWISTIHSFCSKILKKHSIEANLSPAFKMGDENELGEIYDNLIKKITLGESSSIEDIGKIGSKLNIEPTIFSYENLNKLTAINDLEKIFADIFPVIKQIKSLGITPEYFMEKTLNSISNLSSTVKNLPTNVNTQEELAETWNRCLNNYILPSIDFYEITTDNKGKEKYNGIFKEVAKIGFGYINRSRSNWIEKDFKQNIDNITEIEQLMTKYIAYIYALYQNELEKKDLVDFDDLINKTLFILKNNSEIKRFYQTYFEHIIVDEFQDTNGAQLRLLLELLSENNPKITFVGDKKQSIYGFRYAQMENLDLLHKKINKKYNKKYEDIELKYNYRSTPQVLNAVNFITTNELKLAEILSANPNKHFENINDAVKVSVLRGFEETRNYKELEAKYIASEIIKAKKEYSLRYKDFAVLIRSHSQADLLEEELLKYGIPSIKKANTSYFSKKVVKNLYSILNFAQNLRNEIAFIGILKIKSNERKIYELKIELDKHFNSTENKELNLSEKILKLIEDKKFQELNINENLKNYIINIFNTVIELSANKKNLSLLGTYYVLINSIKPYENLKGIQKILADNDLAIFEKILTDFIQSEKYITLKTFNEYLNRIKDDTNFELPKTNNSTIDAVQLLTIHASKGLEFPYVFVANIQKRTESDNKNFIMDLRSDDNIDYSFGLIIKKYNGNENPKVDIYKHLWANPKDKDEQRRLFYVAASRAQNFLNIICGNNSADYINNMDEFKTETIDVNEISVEKQQLEFLQDKPKATNLIKANLITKIEKSTPLNMSFSMLNTFTHCKNKYLLKYKFMYPEISDSEKKRAAIGSILHGLIYYSFVNSKIFTDKELTDYLKDMELTSIETDEILKMYEHYANSCYAPSHVKKALPEYNFQYTINNSNFNGDMDLVIKSEDNSFDIIDFKTNKNIEKSLKDYCKQLYLYKSALEAQDKIVKNCIIFNITSSETKEIYLNENDLTNAKTEFEKDICAAKEFLKNGELQKINTTNCKYCEYKYICQN